jgi:RNA polymerase sigma-70 factor (ECF subfamily)
MMDDKALIEAHLTGDEQAFGQLLGGYLSSVYNFVFQMARDREVTDDIVQETFIKAWKNLSGFDREKSFKTWLFTIAKHTAYDYFKKKKALPFSAFDDGEGGSIFEVIGDGQVLPDELLEREEAAADLDRALEKLPEGSRNILVLAYREDLSLQEIAEVLGEPYNTVKSRHNRALHKLRRVMSEHAPGVGR